MKTLYLILLLTISINAQSLLTLYNETTTATPDTSFSLSDSTGFAAGSVDFGQDTSKTWNVTASNVTWTVDLTDSTQGTLSSASNSFSFNFEPTVEGVYTDSVMLVTSLGDTLYLGITGTGVDTTVASGPAELAGNLHTGTYGYENGTNPGIWANDVGGTTTISVNSADPIYGTYSIDAVMTVLSSITDRPILYFPTSSNLATSTSHTIRFTVRNNTASNVTFRFMYVGGLVNNSDITCTASSTEDKEITINSSTTAYNYFGFYAFEGNANLIDLTFDNVSIKEN